MFKLIGTLVKLALFIGVVLILGNVIRWNGKTVSDQVKTGLASASRAPIVKGARDATTGLLDDARDAISSQSRRPPKPKVPGGSANAANGRERVEQTETTQAHAERIPQEERSLLQAVIQSDGKTIERR